MSAGKVVEVLIGISILKFVQISVYPIVFRGLRLIQYMEIAPELTQTHHSIILHCQKSDPYLLILFHLIVSRSCHLARLPTESAGITL